MPARRELGTVISIDELTPGMFSMWIGTGCGDSSLPGQFVALYSHDRSRILPRPFGICDTEPGKLRLVFRVAGAGTEEFSRYRPGEPVEILGPMGNGFPALSDRALLIGGGSGLPPVYNLMKHYAGEKTAVLGYRDSAMFLREDFAAAGRTVVATEDGSFGVRGNVLDAIRSENLADGAGVIFACGPTPMLRAVKAFAREQGIPCYLSLEERMACGIGACLACVTKSTEKDAHSNVNNKRVCKDGPVFEAGEVEL
jgi:dihydroorotate dehydrogenase electron transfer subunit